MTRDPAPRSETRGPVPRFPVIPQPFRLPMTRIPYVLFFSSVRLNIEQIHLVSVLRLIGACRIEPQGA
jgi:hypothetical protein